MGPRRLALALATVVLLLVAPAAAEVVDPPAAADLERYAAQKGLPAEAVQEAAITGWMAGLMHGCGRDQAVWAPLFRAFVSAQERDGLPADEVASLKIVFEVFASRSANNIVPSDCTEDLAQLLKDRAVERMRAWSEGS